MLKPMLFSLLISGCPASTGPADLGAPAPSDMASLPSDGDPDAGGCDPSACAANGPGWSCQVDGQCGYPCGVDFYCEVGWTCSVSHDCLPPCYFTDGGCSL